MIITFETIRSSQTIVFLFQKKELLENWREMIRRKLNRKSKKNCELAFHGVCLKMLGINCLNSSCRTFQIIEKQNCMTTVTFWNEKKTKSSKISVYDAKCTKSLRSKFTTYLISLVCIARYTVSVMPCDFCGQFWACVFLNLWLSRNSKSFTNSLAALDLLTSGTGHLLNLSTPIIKFMLTAVIQ